ncbi:MAG: proline--tRNA ligase [Candidatus Dormibacteraeota bacterium]|uniref:Proline--tRNA ligase n=1 Tax=Candidatus Dormiibacter inghamiae TaxID=3127013 RepID=A0A934NDU0_9BACT|nr:proline--tRNA ligase [Candidatus Dormibacteraeota bacterium]MBJ7607505.1 proline--tRNA ligase [Candidatus Dormibacteraeota bacterium]
MTETYDDSFVKELTRMSDNFDRWYTDVVRKAELADYTPVRGCMVIRPYGYALWEGIQRAFDDMIKSSGHENWYFPLLIPEELFIKEAEHVEGFTPEVAWVTEAGSHGKLDQRLAIRPTSETIIGTLMRRYVQSHRDLPKLTNQWCNVVRWELRTRLFLRTAEFLWQEGHTFHANAAEAIEEVDRILEYYRVVAEDWCAMPVFTGQKTPSETFPGAVHTKSIEALMRDGLTLQAGTSHYFGQNFSRAYDVSFANRENEREFCYTTSWGMSTRLIGGLIMAHGDDSGLILPPKLVPVQVVVVPIYRTDEARREVAEFIAGWEPGVRAAGIRLKVDWSDERPGAKFNHWELKGVPLRLEVGPRDVAGGQVTAVDRLARQKRPLGVSALAEQLSAELNGFQARLYQRAVEFRQANTVQVKRLAELVDHFSAWAGYVNAPWCGEADCEAKVKEATGGVKSSNYDPDREAEGECLVCGRPARYQINFARSY